MDEAIGHAAAKLGRSAKIPGFRPGKVPATVIRQRFKPQIMQDVAEHLVSKAVGDALIEKGVEPIATPDIKDLVLEEGKPLTFKATFDVVPAFDPGDLSTIEATEPSRAIEDDAVNQSLERLRERNARFEAVESGAVEAGHTVVVASSATAPTRTASRATSTSTSRSASSSARRRILRASTPK